MQSVVDPFGGDLVFSLPASLRRPGAGWFGWSHQYQGDVYVSHVEPLELVLPPSTRAISFYMNVDAPSLRSMMVVADGVSTLTVDTSYFAEGFAFFVDDPRESITRIRISGAGASQFAVGEFAIAIPEPTAGLLLAAGLVLTLRRR